MRKEGNGSVHSALWADADTTPANSSTTNAIDATLISSPQSVRGASPLGLPETLSRRPLRRLAPFAWLSSLRSEALNLDVGVDLEPDPEQRFSSVRDACLLVTLPPGPRRGQ